MKEHANQARSDDTQKLKNIVLHLHNNNTDKFVSLYKRSELGWHNDVSARLLCPTDKLDEYDKDPEK